MNEQRRTEKLIEHESLMNTKKAIANTQQPPLSPGHPTLEDPVGHHATHASRSEMAWLYFLILSFSYELPLLEITSFDRINPRLFDIATLFGALLFLRGLRPVQPFSDMFKWWFKIVIWFTFCAIIWSLLWLPWEEAGIFSLFFAARYVQGLFVVYLALCIPLTPTQKRSLHYTVVAGGVVVALYAIPEYISGETLRIISGGKLVYRTPGTVLGPLGASYAHIAGFSSLVFAMALALFMGNRNRRGQRLLFATTLFISWPSLMSGARSGLLSFVLIFIGGLLFIPPLRTKALRVGLAAALFVGLLAFQLPTLENLRESSATIDRLLGTEESASDNTVMARIGIGKDHVQGYSLDLYQWQGWRLPLFGGGFYAVPHWDSSQLNFRIGYGIHNGYLFPLEQGGLIAFILFICFLVACFKSLRRMTHSPVPEDAAFATGMWLFFLVLLVNTWFGSQIWQGEGMVNFSTYVILLLMLACKVTGEPATARDEVDR